MYNTFHLPQTYVSMVLIIIVIKKLLRKKCQIKIYKVNNKLAWFFFIYMKDNIMWGVKGGASFVHNGILS